MQTLADEFGVSLSVIYRWTNVVELPTEPKLLKPLSARDAMKLDREQRRRANTGDRQRQASEPLPIKSTFAAGEHTYPTAPKHLPRPIRVLSASQKTHITFPLRTATLGT